MGYTDRLEESLAFDHLSLGRNAEASEVHLQSDLLRVPVGHTLPDARLLEAVQQSHRSDCLVQFECIGRNTDAMDLSLRTEEGRAVACGSVSIAGAGTDAEVG